MRIQSDGAKENVLNRRRQMAKRKKRAKPQTPADFWLRGQAIAVRARSLAGEYSHIDSLEARVMSRARRIEAERRTKPE